LAGIEIGGQIEEKLDEVAIWINLFEIKLTLKIIFFSRFAKVLIECVRDITLNEPFRGQIRREDIREFEKDKIEMYKCFRPGDIILARVLSMGEASSGYLLSTAENELGVVIAKSEHSGVKMIPVSWTEMQCPKTYNKEFRKIAKVVPENLGEKSENQ